MALDDLADVLDIKFPTLLVAGYWAERHCVVPDGFTKGQPFGLVHWQALALFNFYRLKLTAQVGQLAPAFYYRRSQVCLPQKAGKAPYTSMHICIEGVGPALFAGWAKGGEVWDCRDHGCGCGWIYEYQPGEAMGMPWPTPLIQITAFSEEQTDNIYDALRPMIDDGPLSDLIPKTGEEFIRLPNKGRIDVVTSSARSRLGQRVTFVPQDETGIWTPQSGMVKVAETQRRGLAGMGGRAEETTNAWDPAEGSVAQRTAESAQSDIYRLHPLPPKRLSYRKKAERRKIHKAVYGDLPWIDLDAVEAEAAEIIELDPKQAERFFGNRVVAGSDNAFDIDVYRDLVAADLSAMPAEGPKTAGFDGALWQDTTGFVLTDIATGYQAVVARWERPRDLPEDEEWEAPTEEVDEAAEMLLSTWDVWKLYGDPPHYREQMARWAGRWPDQVVEFWTNSRKKMATALKAFKVDMRPGLMAHGPLDDSPEARASHQALIQHVGNAVKRPTNIRDEEDGTWLWLISKDAVKSPRKIDLAMAAVLSWEARRDAIEAGVLEKPKTYGRASW